MDFQSIDSPRTKELYAQIVQNDNWGGWGLGKSLYTGERIMEAIFTILGSIVLSLNLFLTPIPQAASRFKILDNWYFGIVFLLVVVGLTILSPLLQNKGEGYWAKASKDATFGNQIFSFFGFRMFNELERATEMRIYRQDIISLDKLNKDNFFGLDGALAKYARGPMGLLKALSQIISSVLMGLIFLYVGLKAWAGAFKVGSFTQYSGALLNLSNGISLLIESLGEMKHNDKFLDLLYEFLARDNRMDEGSLPVKKDADSKYEIEIRNLSFKYPESDEWVLRNISMKFNIGERLAIVGANGSGKTSLIKLLCRLYDPTEGEILLNGVNIKEYDYKDYMSIFSVVFQDFKLFALPLGENIASSIDYNEDRIYQVLKDVGLDIEKGNFPDKLKTYLYKDICEEGVEVSGGEGQKIAIARALYDDSPFVILDEPTASLDPLAEADIYERLNNIIKDKTAIFISHRLSSCRFADRILVFDKGKIVEDGNHNTLLERKGTYAQLWEAQAKHYT